MYRNLSLGSHSYDWSDGKKPQFIKPIIRDHQLSVYGHTFVSRPTISIKSKSMSKIYSNLKLTHQIVAFTPGLKQNVNGNNMLLDCPN
ncbi:unnamed protein product [Schistosoma margrebowiei]|uniref:Uncharacterized protein n=1 Tax=Schistosoma margrebowiei TaxID=48269 RepID=A0A3P7ZME9_9TREM|nr:unnamed protein product [Schistosoma margrebowiei]